jgi:hypothetical protein
MWPGQGEPKRRKTKREEGAVPVVVFPLLLRIFTRLLFIDVENMSERLYIHRKSVFL